MLASYLEANRKDAPVYGMFGAVLSFVAVVTSVTGLLTGDFIGGIVLGFAPVFVMGGILFAISLVSWGTKTRKTASQVIPMAQL